MKEEPDRRVADIPSLVLKTPHFRGSLQALILGLIAGWMQKTQERTLRKESELMKGIWS